MKFKTEKKQCAGCHGRGYLLHKEWACKRCNGEGYINVEIEIIKKFGLKWVVLAVVVISVIAWFLI